MNVNEISDITLKLLDFNKMMELCNTESDRGAAILAASHLEAFLGDCLLAFLIDDNYVEERLFERGPLSSFDGRIDMAFALGLISREVRSNLHAIRRIRNYFAHARLLANFSDNEVKRLCNAFSISVFCESEVYNHVKKHPDPRDRYLFVVEMCALGLESIMRCQTRRTLLEVDSKR